MSCEIVNPNDGTWDLIENEFQAFSIDWSSQLYNQFCNNNTQIPVRVFVVCELISDCEKELKYSRDERDYVKIYLYIKTIYNIMFDNVG